MCGEGEGAGAQAGLGFMDYTSLGAVVNGLNALGAATIANGGPNEAPGASVGNGYGGNSAVSGRVDGPDGRAFGPALTDAAVQRWQQQMTSPTGPKDDTAYDMVVREGREADAARQREAAQGEAEARVRADQQRQQDEAAARERREHQERIDTQPTDTPRPARAPSPAQAAASNAAPVSMVDVARAAVASPEVLGGPTGVVPGPVGGDPGPSSPVGSIGPRHSIPGPAPAPVLASPIAATVAKTARPGPAPKPQPKPAAGLYNGLSTGSPVRVVR
jgi:hypothetical protein